MVVLFAPGSADGSLPFLQADKVVHAGVFALLAATGRWRFGPVAWVLLAVCAYAPLSEVVQTFLLPHRDGDWRDAAADLLGVALGWRAAAGLLQRR